jgi:sugar diacid utilization regulator
MEDQGSSAGDAPAQRRATPAEDEAWLADVARAAAAEAGAPVELLGHYLRVLADAAISGRRSGPDELALVSTYGRRAATTGVAAAPAVNLYLSAAWRLWRELPLVARSSDSETVRAAADAVLHVVGEAVAVVVDGYQDERRQSIRREESVRREFIDDLLRGDADVAALVERAEPFGLDLTAPHQLALARALDGARDLDLLAGPVERAVVSRFGDREVLVATKENFLVVLVPAAPFDDRSDDVGALMSEELFRARSRGGWRVAVGRAYAGAYGIARSYEEAREALHLANRLGLASSVVHARDLLVYRVLGRDQAAMIDLVQAVLSPLDRARGGAEPLLETLQTYFTAGNGATETARRMHLSVRAVTYRLDRVRQLTGYHVAIPEQRFALQAAVLGARLLGWPQEPLPS